MTTDIIRVSVVSGWSTRLAGVQQFIIDGTLVANGQCLQLQTTNSFAASLCDEARKSGRAIAVDWVTTKYGSTLRRAYFLKAEARV